MYFIYFLSILLFDCCNLAYRELKYNLIQLGRLRNFFLIFFLESFISFSILTRLGVKDLYISVLPLTKIVEMNQPLNKRFHEKMKKVRNLCVFIRFKKFPSSQKIRSMSTYSRFRVEIQTNG